MILFKTLKIRSYIRKIKAMQHSRLHNQVSNEEMTKEINLYRKLITIYQSLNGNKKFPFAELMIKECLRAAASLDDAASQYELALKLLEEAKYRDNLQQQEIFANKSNERQVQQLFEESHAYLTAAENLHHVLAKRMRGLCYINGWGVDIDKNKGFELVVASIQQENSWDKVPQIFAEIGLNKPEFFTALMKHRGKS